jgi:hypothetical protein
MPPPDQLPSPLREALLAEIDPGETLRWCGQPLPARIFRRALPGAFALFAFPAVFAGVCIGLAIHTWHELSDPAAVAARNKDNIASVIFMLFLGAALGALAIAALASPWYAKARALRTIYAVTNTRVLILVRLASGRLRTDAVEPGHPLAINRREHADGSGDIVLHPLPRPLLVLAAAPEPRAVERLIRATFDPPGHARPSN